jgi:hypothetical protein
MERPTPPTPAPVLVEQKPKPPDTSYSNTDSYNFSFTSQPVMASLGSSQSEALDTVPLTTSSSDEHVISAPIIGGFPSPELEPTSLPSPQPTTPATPTAEGGMRGGDGGCTFLNRECFPMGSRISTLYEKGWLDIACGPSITIDIQYSSNDHNPSPGDHTPLLPNVLRVNVDAPVALIRVFGCLARDLLGLKVSM